MTSVRTGPRSIRATLAFQLAKRLYAQPVVSDTPKSQSFFALRYGTFRKFHNYWLASSDYRRRRTRLKGYPYAIRVDPISVCNLRCPLCPTGIGELKRPTKPMLIDTFSQVLDELGPFAFLAHLWVWGEPLLHKELWRMVALAEERGVGTEVSTNLSVVLSDRQIDELVVAGLSWLIVSVDGTSPESYNLYRRGGNFPLVLSNMRRIVERKKALGSLTPFVEWQFVPLRHNESEMGEAERLAREIGVDGLRFKPARLDKTQELTVSGQVPERLREQWAARDPRLHHQLDATHESFHDFHCPFLWGHVTIHPNAAIAPCCETYKTSHDFGRFGEQNFSEVWNGPTYTEARRIALGRDLAPNDQRFACHDCRVFKKPDLPRQSLGGL
jgi:MoaA/NifB/PqqE/SkfB family radical SAM enzyme